MRNLLKIFLLFTLVSSAASAQEGHPLKGSWIGEWQGNEALGEFVLLVMDWNGSEVTGVINPGTDDIAIESVELDPSDWSVTIEGGDYEIQGNIVNLELPSRTIVGTWRSGRSRGDFEISRQ